MFDATPFRLTTSFVLVWVNHFDDLLYKPNHISSPYSLELLRPGYYRSSCYHLLYKAHSNNFDTM